MARPEPRTKSVQEEDPPTMTLQLPVQKREVRTLRWELGFIRVVLPAAVFYYDVILVLEVSSVVRI